MGMRIPPCPPGRPERPTLRLYLRDSHPHRARSFTASPMGFGALLWRPYGCLRGARVVWFCARDRVGAAAVLPTSRLRSFGTQHVRNVGKATRF
jgi:hypothetical protein